MFLKNKKASLDAKIVFFAIIFVILLLAAGILFIVYYNKSTKPYELNLFSNPAHAAVYLESYDSNSQPSGTTLESAKYLKDTKITVTTNAKQGFVFENWSDSKNNVLSSDENYSFLMPAKNINLYANFKPITQETVSLSLIVKPLGSGSVEGAGEYLPNEKVTVKAIPNNNFEFESWSDSNEEVVSTSPSYSFNMPEEDYTLTANFKLKGSTPPIPEKYTLSLLVTPVNSGDVNGAGEYSAGEIVRLKATPKTNYVFEKWVEGSSGKTLSTASSFDLNMPANNYTVTANFKLSGGGGGSGGSGGGGSGSGGDTKYTLSLSSNPRNISVLTGAGSYKSGESVTVKTNIKTEYLNDYNFDCWKDSSGVLKSYDENYTFSMPAKNYSLTAHYKTDVTNPKYLLSLFVSPPGAGNVTGGGSFSAGKKVTVVATISQNNPAHTFVFKNWKDSSGKVVSTSASYSFNMPANDYNLTAYFESTSVPSKFISTWDTRKIKNAGEPNNQITLPLVNDGVYDFDVNWGDGTPIKQITTQNYNTQKTHAYAIPGVYEITITGTIKGFSFKNYANETNKILDISNWGPLNLGNSGYYFRNAINLNITATDVLDLEGTTNLTYMFSNTINLTFNNSINNWDVSNITNMRGLFNDANKFNQPLKDWNTSNVTDMEDMFNGAYKFNKPLNDWNVSNVTNMKNMFRKANSFNQALNNWNVSNVTYMGGMFYYATNFNRPLNTWNTSNVTYMSTMFAEATSFNQSLADWNISKVQYMGAMLDNTNLSTENYDLMLNSWGAVGKNPKQGVSFGVGTTKYSSAALTARNRLENQFGWVIIDGGQTTPLKYTLTLNKFPNQAGTVSGAGSYAAGVKVPVNAIANPGYVFNKWVGSDGVVITSASYELTMPANNYTLTAYFEEEATPPTPGSEFISTWDTRKPGGSSSNEINLPLVYGGTYDFVVDWGDGKTDTIKSYSSPNKKHTYATTGVYEIKITGTIEGFSFNDSGDKLKLLNITQWGSLKLGNTGGYFHGAKNFNITANDVLDLNGTTNLTNMFHGATSLNANIENWNVSKVTKMTSMFANATSFNQPLNNWNVSKVTDMSAMFYGATSFNQPLDNWNVSKVKKMSGLYTNAINFDQNIEKWDVSNVTDMSYMFEGTTSFNQPLNEWILSSATSTVGMFYGATSFNQPLDKWNVSNVTDMSYMFYEATSFNKSLNDWNVLNVTNMERMFKGATSFNQPLNNWNVSKVTSMGYMFDGAKAFNKSLSNWDVSSVIYAWFMFNGATSFNQPLASWDVTSVKYMANMLTNTSLSIDNYDDLLNSWAQKELQQNVIFDATPTKYSSAAKDARYYIWDNFKWIITDGDLKEDDEYILELLPHPLHGGSVSGAGSYAAGVNVSVTAEASTGFEFDKWVGSDGVVITSASYKLTMPANNYTLTAYFEEEATPPTPPTPPIPGAEFISTWDTRKTSEGSSASNQISLPLVSSGTYNFTVDWGDGTTNTITSWNSPNKLHTYNIEKEYTIKINGIINGFSFNNSGDKFKLLDVSQWGCLNLGNTGGYFYGAKNLNFTATDNLNLENTTNLSNMFKEATDFNSNIESWDVSNVTDMSYMFFAAANFNKPLNDWVVSKVVNMEGMFWSATSFNQPLNKWNVSKVTNMKYMFSAAWNFNSNINSWNVSSVTNMSFMFWSANSFNQPLNDWNVSSVTNMSNMFFTADNFNQALNKWNVSSVTNMSGMFKSQFGSFFDQSLADWNVTNITNMTDMLKNTSLSIENYDALLISWAQKNLKQKVTFGAYPAKYSEAAENARQTIKSQFNWTISDDGLASELFLYVEPENSGNVNGAGIKSVGESVTVTASAKSGYAFESWIDSNGVPKSYDESYTFSMPRGGYSLTAYFEEAQPPEPTFEFESKWDTRNTSDGSSASNQISLPLVSSGIYDFIVDWGDNTTNTITSWNDSNKTHTYNTQGIYTIKITGDIKGFSFNDLGDKLKLLNISQWGPLNLGNTGGYFHGAKNLNISAKDKLDLEGTTNLSYMFKNATSFNANIESWDVSYVTNMSGMFEGVTSFNQALNNWNVSSVTNMSYMFSSTYFNQDLNKWIVSNVNDMSYMFFAAANFNKPLNDWNVSNVVNMEGVFWSATSFNQPLNDWNVSNVTNMKYMFSAATLFNSDISSWNVSKVTNMSNMFASTDVFNQSLNNWNVSNVVDMEGMFWNAKNFNQSLASWNVSNVTNMKYMFRADYGSSFDQSLASWNVSNVTDMYYMLKNTKLTTENYDEILISWSQLSNLQKDVRLDATPAKYSAAAASARQILTNPYGLKWHIYDGGLVAD